ncbi:ABC transporter substrate-binding protein [Jiangella ureilytica]|uniref:ABC transporter substrate-binding protein n=1 Tax=Jiangella ureilytica TaxID=2530374 RepID=A0A4R4RS29_9ACTN|nr:ABC transporter substrate-binding protein [Jiangella ureilytica]TDC52777.1 ABC transporter substrate-binding protein [Jiangella ureilytica]
MAVLLVAACSSSGSDGSETPASGEDEEPTTLTIAVEGDITTLDAHGGAGILDRNILQNVHEGLIRRDGSTGEVIPHIATEWEVSEDQLTWTMKLRDDVYFHDGQQLTAADVKASAERLLDPELAAQQSGVFSNLAEVVVVDDFTADFKLSVPEPLFIIFCERMTLVPAGWAEEVGPTIYTGDDPIGLGAYKVAEWVRGERLVLEANEDYFLGAPEIDELIFRPIPDEASRVAALRAGEVDIVDPLSSALREQVEGDSTLKIVESLSMGRVRVTIDQRVAPFDVKEVRQAINHAIDVDTIIEELVPGAVRTPAALVPEEVGFDSTLEPYDYDPDRARELLADAGFADGIGPVELSVNPSYPQMEEAAQAVQSYLSEVGIETTIRVYDPGDFTTRKREKFDNPAGLGPLHMDGHSGGNTFHGYHIYSNVINCTDASPVHSGYGCNADVERLLGEALAMWTQDEEAAIEKFHEMEAVLQEDAWAGFLYQVPALNGAKADLEWEPSPAEPLQMRFARWSSS